MPRSVQPVLNVFANRSVSALRLASNAEVAWRNRPGGTTQIEGAYQTAFLRVFDSWTTFLDDLAVRLLCGYVTGRAVVLRAPKCATITAAKDVLYGGADHVLWYVPATAAKRFTKHFNASHIEATIRAVQPRLEALRWIRHRSAHPISPDVQARFENSTLLISGRVYRGPSSAGRFLRDWNRTVAPPERWLETVTEDLLRMARGFVL